MRLLSMTMALDQREAFGYREKRAISYTNHTAMPEALGEVPTPSVSCFSLVYVYRRG